MSQTYTRQVTHNCWKPKQDGMLYMIFFFFRKSNQKVNMKKVIFIAN